MPRALVLTHTDATVDSRIVKTHTAAEKAGFTVKSIGVVGRELGGRGQSVEAKTLLKLKVKDFRDRYLAQTVRPATPISRMFFLLIYLELSVKMVSRGVSFRPRVIHCNDWFVLPIAVTIKILTRAKLIYDAHELESKTTTDPNIPGEIVERIEQLCWSWIDYFITVSPSIQHWYLDRFGEKPSAVVLNAPVFNPTISKTGRPSYLRDKYNLASTTRIYLYIGMLSVGRGIETMLRAFLSTKSDVALVFLGYGPYEEDIKLAAGGGSNVFIHERVDHERVVPIAQSADFGMCLIEDVSLSDYYCIPNKLLEYAFAGVPVIASRLPEISRIVEQYSLGICVENTSESLLVALDAGYHGLTTVPASGERLLELSWEAQEVKLVDAFRHVLLGSR